MTLSPGGPPTVSINGPETQGQSEPGTVISPVIIVGTLPQKHYHLLLSRPR